MKGIQFRALKRWQLVLCFAFRECLREEGEERGEAGFCGLDTLLCK